MPKSDSLTSGANAAASGAVPKIGLARQGAMQAIVLQRPETLNAFDDEMRQILANELPKIARNPDVYIVTLQSTSPKAFCAGGDVKALTAEAKTDLERVKGYFRGEYALDWHLECFSKPTVSLINGICMGSGAGLTCYNTHRVAGENYKWAMPETAIGLFPDVGVAHVLARMRWPLGLYLGLTGRSIGRADAHWLGLASHCIPAAKFEHICQALGDAQPVDPLLDHLHEPQGNGPLHQESALIEGFFSAGSVHKIVENLERASKGSGASIAWAERTLADLRKKSPISLAITDRQIRSARALDLRETLIQDYRLAVRCLEGNDFYEGVRALLVDKDGAPRFSPVRLEDVTEAMVDAYFAPLGAADLRLPTREEMQAARV